MLLFRDCVRDDDADSDSDSLPFFFFFFLSAFFLLAATMAWISAGVTSTTASGCTLEYLLGSATAAYKKGAGFRVVVRISHHHKRQTQLQTWACGAHWCLQT